MPRNFFNDLTDNSEKQASFPKSSADNPILPAGAFDLA